jgi:hypothetical protein
VHKALAASLEISSTFLSWNSFIGQAKTANAAVDSFQLELFETRHPNLLILHAELFYWVLLGRTHLPV